MTDVIKDGTGKGYLAKVNSNNELAVEGIVESSFHRNSEKDMGFVIATPILAVTATGGRALRAVPTDLPAHIAGFTIGWNGGNTNHNRMLEVEVYFGEGAPTANHVALAARSTISGSVRVPAFTTWRWDGVGNGMTGMSAGSLIMSCIVGPGCTFVPIDGMLAITLASAMSINLKGEEAGNATFKFTGYSEELP